MSGSVISSFQRYELKYQLTPAQKQALLPILSEHFQVDIYGRHTIHNIFYDTENFELLRRSIEQPVYKEKLRVRSYGTPVEGNDNVFIELKKKCDGVVYKRRILAHLPEAEHFLQTGLPPVGSDPQICREINAFMRRYQPEPRVYVSYERVAFYCPDDPDLRITMDEDLLWRDYDLDLRKGAYGGYILPPETTLMEIKIPGVMPLWLARALSENQVYKQPFSKIGSCYKQFILPEYFK